jgi:tetratricopeptide (TPR) repeat protein
MYLDILEGSGLLGLLAFGWLAFSIGKRYLSRLAVAETGGKEQAILVGSMAALATYAVHGIFDGVYLMTFATSTLIIILGASLSVPESESPSRRGIPVYIGLCVVALAWTNLWLANPLIQGIQSFENGNYSSAAQWLTQAVQRDSWQAITHQQAGMVDSFQAYQGDSTALQPAIQAFEETIKLDPDWSLNYANLGALYAQQGSLDKAVQEFQKAIKVNASMAVYSLNLGQTLEKEQQPAQAQQAYFQTLALRPDWANTYFWRETPLRTQVVATWLAENPPANVTVQDPASLEGGTVEGYAIDFLSPVETLLAANKIDEADRLVSLAGLAYFNNNEERLEYQWMQAALAARKGNLTQAVQLGEQALDGYRHQGAFGPGTYGQTVYASQLFHSFAVKDDYVPQMTLIVLTDTWGQREEQLISWYRQLGNTQRAAQLTTELTKYIPDFSPSK